MKTFPDATTKKKKAKKTAASRGSKFTIQQSRPKNAPHNLKNKPHQNATALLQECLSFKCPDHGDKIALLVYLHLRIMKT